MLHEVFVKGKPCGKAKQYRERERAGRSFVIRTLSVARTRSLTLAVLIFAFCLFTFALIQSALEVPCA